ncbi:sensor histidine kinase [Calidithermus roseus]|uniref:histidine kinase n=1 Tax=Calidithermus roseus TaxID=1644118 RepID=A0A399EJH2_9DEIN|nr:HAMP domain-containing sensor histidine kinase [Calidithermus roseus]RIH84275.1 Signal transduction histidine-protein kinase/phosphatase MprB [Calidithermus roseus]
MSLRLRLTAFAATLVGLVLLILSGALRLSLEQRLLAQLDEDLEAALDLARPLVGRDLEDGSLRLLPDRSLEVLPRLLPELVLVLADSSGVRDALGRLPPPEEVAALAHVTAQRSSWQGYRVGSLSVGPGLHLVAALPLSTLKTTLGLLDNLMLALVPLSFLLSFALGYLLLGRGLAPVDHLTRTALRLAEEGEWRARLPEPRTRDELWRLGRAVNHLLEKLGSLIEREQRLSQDAAHALRTPLTVLLGRLERLPESPDLALARRGAEELRGLVEKLLLLSRTEAGGLQKEALDLDALAFEVAEEMRDLFAAKGLAFHLELSETPLEVWGDPTVLRAAVQALLENAHKFTASGAVGLRVWPEEGWACLEVWDTGPGIPPGAEAVVFERFYRSGRAPEGSGLGLALVAAVARWHGGEVWTESRRPMGARVSFRLPLRMRPGPHLG